MSEKEKFPVLVVCNAPDSKTAAMIAQGLVERRLAACVNILSPCRSIYRWQGAVVGDEEHPLLIKTVRDCLPAVREWVTEAHPYEVPELVVLDIVDGLPAYLEWLCESCGEGR